MVIEGWNGLVVRPVRAGEEDEVRDLVSGNLWTAIRWEIGKRVLWTNPAYIVCLVAALVVVALVGGLVCAFVGLFILPVLSYWVLYWRVTRSQSDQITNNLRDITKNYIQPQRNNLWVGIFKGRIIGCVAVEDVGDVSHPTDVAILRSMSVDASYQGLGIGKRLLKDLIAFCKAQHYKEIRLGTTEFQTPAQKLYEKNGFRRTGTTRVPLPLGKTMEVRRYAMRLNYW